MACLALSRWLGAHQRVGRAGPRKARPDGRLRRNPPLRHRRTTGRDLQSLDDASRPEDLNLPGFRFHALVGRDKGRYAVNASGNWRITFGWTEGDAVDVDLEDYH